MSRRLLATRPSGWSRFVAEHPRAAVIGLGQAAVLAFASDALFVPFLLVVGAHPALVSLIGILPVVGSAAQTLLPRALARMDGNLGRIVLLLTVAGETRGLLFAVIAAAWTLGVLPGDAAIALTSAVVVLAGSAGLVAESSLQSWLAVVLSDRQRRRVLPRLLGIAAGASAILLVPAGLVLEALPATQLGAAFSILFAIAGVASIPLTVAIRGLPRPRRVTVHADEVRATGTPQLRRFTVASLWNSVGLGFTPYMAVFAVGVHHMSPGYAVLLSGLWSAVSLITSAAAGSFLAHGSASWLLRASYLARGVGLAGSVLAFPGNPHAGVIIAGAVVLNAAGFTATTVGQAEQLFRLASGRAAIAHQGRFVALNAGAFTVAGLAGTGLVAIAERVGFVAWIAMFGMAAGTRLVAARLTDVPATWRSASLAPAPLAETQDSSTVGVPA